MRYIPANSLGSEDTHICLNEIKRNEILKYDYSYEMAHEICCSNVNAIPSFPLYFIHFFHVEKYISHRIFQKSCSFCELNKTKNKQKHTRKTHVHYNSLRITIFICLSWTVIFEISSFVQRYSKFYSIQSRPNGTIFGSKFH